VAHNDTLPKLTMALLPFVPKEFFTGDKCENVLQLSSASNMAKLFLFRSWIQWNFQILWIFS
jgi:hypothetical protein